MSPDCTNLILNLMNKDKTTRLGAGKYGAEEVKNHQYFKDVNWDHVESKLIPSPFIKYSIKRNQSMTNKHKKYDFLIKTYGYPKEINNILKDEILDSPDRGSYLQNWSTFK